MTAVPMKNYSQTDRRFCVLLRQRREIFVPSLDLSKLYSKVFLLKGAKSVKKITVSENKLFGVFVATAIKELSEIRQVYLFNLITEISC